MKVLHVCLGAFYIDNFSYQENMLTKYHKQLGYDVEIIASLVSFDENGKPCILKKTSPYINEHGIKVTRLEYKSSIINKILRRYKGLMRELKRSNPDIIFIHGCQFKDIKIVVNYLSKHPNVKVFVDNHADFSNSATNWLSKNILHKIIWKRCAQLIEPYTEKFYGVLPARVEFLKNIYKVPEEKVELLLMGADDELVEKADEKQREINRKKYNIKDDDFLIVTGGKIDLAKQQTLLLMKAIKEINKENVKLIIFGSIVEELKDEVYDLIDGEKINYIGWVESRKSYEIFNAADLVVFPGRHSVYWEQVAGQGVPMVVKYWPGTDHIDVGGNCKFLYEDSVEEITKKLTKLLSSTCEYEDMQKKAESIGKKKFSYSVIAKQSIEFN